LWPFDSLLDKPLHVCLTIYQLAVEFARRELTLYLSSIARAAIVTRERVTERDSRGALDYRGAKGAAPEMRKAWNVLGIMVTLLLAAVLVSFEVIFILQVRRGHGADVFVVNRYGFAVT
jgi:hypothetical protein